MYVYVKHVKLMTFLLVAVRKVAASHKMVVQGHTTVAEGWDLFEAVEEAGPGDLPNLLHQLKGKTTPNTDAHTTPTSIADGSWEEDPYATPCFTS